MEPPARYNWRAFSGERHGMLNLFWEWIRGEEKDKARQADFLTPSDPFGNNPDEK